MNLVSTCCNQLMESDDRYCPRCGWECYVESIKLTPIGLTPFAVSFLEFLDERDYRLGPHLADRGGQPGGVPG